MLIRVNSCLNISVMTIEQLYEIYKQYPSVQIDSRKIKEDDIFFALKGEKFDGHHFLERAFEARAAYAVIDDPKYAEFGQTALVENSLATLQALAKYHRQQFKIPFIAITGSNGKTTTKELVHAVLSQKFKTYTTEGNLNNHIGVPLTLLRIKEDAEIAVIEMGANHLHEIESYCEWAMPTHGLITNCGKAHLEGFGSEEGVRKAKGELFDYLRAQNGTVFIMSDYDYLREMSKGIALVSTYGEREAEVEGISSGQTDYLNVNFTKGMGIETINTKLVGEYNLPNVLAAVAIGKFFHVEEHDIKKAIENYVPSNSRSQLVQMESNKLIMDAYNANPSSMKTAIENFATMPGQNKILMLGAMAELGSDSLYEHEQILLIIQRYQWKEVVLVGGDFTKLGHPYIQFQNSEEAANWFKNQEFENCYILIKGSRSLQMEKVVE